MRFIEDLCPPALLYLVFLVVQLGLDAANGMFVTFAIKAILGVSAVVFLDILCGMGLGAASRFLVAAPFIITALGTAIALGIHLDDMFLRETFVDPKARPGDVPADSNAL